MTALDGIIESLLGFELIYLATPYTKYKWGIDAAAVDAGKVAGRLLTRGVKVFSPIVHAHYISMVTGIDPIDHDFWMRADAAYMNKSDALLVCRMAGWEESFGVNEEIKNFVLSNKPIFHIDPGFTR